MEEPIKEPTGPAAVVGDSATGVVEEPAEEPLNPAAAQISLARVKVSVQRVRMCN